MNQAMTFSETVGFIGKCKRREADECTAIAADPYDDCPAAAHGTSVTGIIGANRNETGFLGVAPDVSLALVSEVCNKADKNVVYFGW